MEKEIEDLESVGDDFHDRRAFYLKKRSAKYSRRNKKVEVMLINNRFFLPEYPINPTKVKVWGFAKPITTFLVHGKEIVWTGARMDRPPSKITVEYDSFD